METTVFTNEALGVDLTIIKHENGDLLFPAVAVAKMLGYKDPHDAVKKHCKSPKTLKYGETPDVEIIGFSKATGVILIKESDLYRLTMKSKLKSAVKFQDWVCEEVLPEIRRTGSYHINPEARERSMHECLTEMSDEQFAEYITVVSEMRKMKVTIETQQQLINKQNEQISIEEDNKLKALEDFTWKTHLSFDPFVRTFGISKKELKKWLVKLDLVEIKGNRKLVASKKGMDLKLVCNMSLANGSTFLSLSRQLCLTYIINECSHDEVLMRSLKRAAKKFKLLRDLINFFKEERV